MKTIVFVAVAVLTSFASFAGITVRSQAEGRTWQTARNLEPISWCWQKGDTSADLLVTSLCMRASKVYHVERSGDATYGSQSLEVPLNGSEGLYDLCLTIYAGDAVRTAMTARVCYLASITVGKTCVVPASDKAWRRLGAEPRAMAYDAAWQEGASEPVSLSYVCGPTVAAASVLQGKSGYAAVDACIPYPDGIRGNFTLEMGFEGVVEPWVAPLCKYLPGGLLLIVR